jgi:hypothetical protein
MGSQIFADLACSLEVTLFLCQFVFRKQIFQSDSIPQFCLLLGLLAKLSGHRAYGSNDHQHRCGDFDNVLKL